VNVLDKNHVSLTLLHASSGSGHCSSRNVVPHDTDLWILARHLVGYFLGAVSRSIVDNKKLNVGRQLRSQFQ
jgi:hypothetical protein